MTKCVKTWEILNHDWEVVRLDKSNLHKFIDLNEIVPNYEQKQISEASLSDMIRLLLLKKYGGLWVDATMFCNEPLSNWFFRGNLHILVRYLKVVQSRSFDCYIFFIFISTILYNK